VARAAPLVALSGRTAGEAVISALRRKDRTQSTARSAERYAESLARSPFGRYGDPEVDIGRAVAWLCSDEASYITGSMIMLDGGRYYQQCECEGLCCRE